MKNAGKACNNRLYRHIRTFEKIVKNYFVILGNFTTFLAKRNIFFYNRSKFIFHRAGRIRRKENGRGFFVENKRRV